MALQHNVLENGEWVTRTLEAQELFRQTTASSQAKPKKQPSMPPEYGILTKTVIESPIIQRVLPAQLRSPSNNDVAFIGVGTPTISQLYAACVSWPQTHLLFFFGGVGGLKKFLPSPVVTVARVLALAYHP